MADSGPLFFFEISLTLCDQTLGPNAVSCFAKSVFLLAFFGPPKVFCVLYSPKVCSFWKKRNMYLFSKNPFPKTPLYPFWVRCLLLFCVLYSFLAILEVNFGIFFELSIVINYLSLLCLVRKM